jgi:putative lipoprotein
LKTFSKKRSKPGWNFTELERNRGWSLEMDMKNIFSFKSYDGVKMNTPPVAGVNKGGVTVYRMQVEMGEMIITLVETECSDVMSGQKFPYQVSLNIKRGIDSTYREYNGCGRMLK